jgi:glycosyltransferase involved in cell wall biosynthesis
MTVSSADERVRVLYWFNQPTPYVVARFNAAAERPELDFHAVFSEVRQSDRSWNVDESEWNFPARYLGRVRLPLRELVKLRPDVFLLEYDRWNLAVGAALGFVYAKRVGFRVLPNFDAWSQRTWWREAGKHLLFKAIDGAKVSGPDGAALATRYGLPEDRIATVTQSINVAHYSRSREMPAEDRHRRRGELGLSGCVFIYVGRLWAGKGLDELFEAYRRLYAIRSDVTILIVGDGVEYERYVHSCSDLPSVKFAGFVQPAALPEWYAICDVLVFPTHGDPNGLVVEEALAAGLPVITSDAAGDIWTRVPETVGCIFPVGDVDALVKAMLLLADPLKRQPMRHEGSKLVEHKDDQRYAEDLVRFAQNLVRQPRRRTVRRIACTVLGQLLSRPWRPHDLIPRDYRLGPKMVPLRSAERRKVLRL